MARGKNDNWKKNPGLILFLPIAPWFLILREAKNFAFDEKQSGDTYIYRGSKSGSRKFSVHLKQNLTSNLLVMPSIFAIFEFD